MDITTFLHVGGSVGCLALDIGISDLYLKINMKKILALKAPLLLLFVAILMMAMGMVGTPWVLCSTGVRSFKMEPAHQQHCCTNTHVRVAQREQSSSFVFDDECTPCNDEVLTFHQQQARRSMQLHYHALPSAVLPVPMSVMQSIVALSLSYFYADSPGVPIGYLPLSTVIRV